MADYVQEVYKRMIERLSSTGVYRLDGGSVTEKEMQLYAKQIGGIYEKLAQMRDDCFVISMTPEGARRYCTLYGLPTRMKGEELATIVRRRLAVTNRDFTPEGVARCMASGGLGVTLSEDFAAGKVTVTVNTDMDVFGTREEKEAFMRECLPCHVVPVFVWNV